MTRLFRFGALLLRTIITTAMTYLCVPIFVSSVDQARRDAALAAEHGADLVEFRIDDLSNPKDVAAIVAASTLPCIITCRPAWEGGHCALAESGRVAMLEAAFDAKAAYVDVELAAPATAGTLLGSPRDLRPGIILSSHDFSGRPDRLYNILAEMNASPADVNKLAWTARTVRDNLEAFEIIRSRQKPTIALCMGEAGILSRILAKKFGAFLTFASLTKDSGTAPGQVTIADMKSLYRWDAINPQTKVYGVVGSPVMHSMSPAIHNAAFTQISFDGVYVPILVNEGYESFKAFMESFLAMDGLHLSGLSVTIPHKENALRYLLEKGAEVDDLARRIGAINTIVVERSTKAEENKGIRGQGDKETINPQGTKDKGQRTTDQSAIGNRQWAIALRGFSTDYSAILDSITSALSITRVDLKGRSVAVIGAGGTGRTAVAALAHCGANVTIYNRTMDRALALSQEFNGHTGLVVADPLEKLRQSQCQIYLNTTSLGMSPKVDASPFDPAGPALSPDTLVFDSVYNPIETKLLRQARQAGAKTVSGVEMFVRQAAGQFEAWTGVTAPVDLMRRVVETRLSR